MTGAALDRGTGGGVVQMKIEGDMEGMRATVSAAVGRIETIAELLLADCSLPSQRWGSA